MSERQSSGLVKKGKFVRRLLEILEQGLVLSIEGIMSEGKGEIGPSQDYVQSNLDKLVASGEVKFENGEYSVPNAKPRNTPVHAEETAMTPASPATEPKAPAAVTRSIVMVGDTLPRDSAFELFLACAFMNEIPGWENAANYYCATHGAKWSIVKFAGKIGGERIKFD